MNTRCRGWVALLLFALSPVAAALMVVGSTPSVAQDAQGLMNLFGNMMGAALSETARTEWSKLGPTETACLETGLPRQGLSVEQLIQSARIAEVGVRIARFVLDGMSRAGSAGSASIRAVRAGSMCR